MANENASKRQQINDFELGKAIDPRDKGALDFVYGRGINQKEEVFLEKPLDPKDRSAQVFLGSIPLHPSAKDFLGD